MTPYLCPAPSRAPDVRSRRQGLKSRRADVQSRRPDVQSRRPDLAFRRPDVKSCRQDLAFRRPDVTFRRPDVTFRRRDVTSKQLFRRAAHARDALSGWKILICISVASGESGCDVARFSDASRELRDRFLEQVNANEPPIE